MARARRPCKTHGHADVAERDGFCITCLTRREAERGSSSARGYGRDHRSAREAAKPAVATGRVRCWRCEGFIGPAEPWDMGHDDSGRQRGPEHRSGCNLRAAGLKAHGKPWTPRS